jgi:hypothetical protein
MPGIGNPVARPANTRSSPIRLAIRIQYVPNRLDYVAEGKIIQFRHRSCGQVQACNPDGPRALSLDHTVLREPEPAGR